MGRLREFWGRGAVQGAGSSGTWTRAAGRSSGPSPEEALFVWPAVLFYICQHLKIEKFNIKPQISGFLGTFLHGICQPNLNSSSHSPHHSNFFFRRPTFYSSLSPAWAL